MGPISKTDMVTDTFQSFMARAGLGSLSIYRLMCLLGHSLDGTILWKRWSILPSSIQPPEFPHVSA